MDHLIDLLGLVEWSIFCVWDSVNARFKCLVAFVLHALLIAVLKTKRVPQGV